MGQLNDHQKVDLEDRLVSQCVLTFSFKEHRINSRPSAGRGAVARKAQGRLQLAQLDAKGTPGICVLRERRASRSGCSRSQVDQVDDVFFTTVS